MNIKYPLERKNTRQVENFRKRGLKPTKYEQLILEYLNITWLEAWEKSYELKTLIMKTKARIKYDKQMFKAKKWVNCKNIIPYKGRTQLLK